MVKVIGEEEIDTELSKVYDDYYLIYKEAYEKFKVYSLNLENIEVK